MSDYDDYMKALLHDLAASKTFEQVCQEQDVLLKLIHDSRARVMQLSLGNLRALARGIDTPGGKVTFVKEELAEFLDVTSDLDNKTVVVVMETGLDVMVAVRVLRR